MKGKEWFTMLGLLGVGIYVYQRFVNPRCRWCGTALQAVAVGQTVACPACRRAR